MLFVQVQEGPIWSVKRPLPALKGLSPLPPTYEETPFRPPRQSEKGNLSSVKRESWSWRKKSRFFPSSNISLFDGA